MQSTTAIKATGVLAIIGLVATAVAMAAPVKEVSGTMADVRAYCTSDGQYLIDAESYTLCVGEAEIVICRDDDVCESTDMTFRSRDGEVAAY